MTELASLHKMHQEAAREAAMVAVLRGVERLAEKLEVEEDPEILVKIVNSLKDIAQAVPEKKSDPYAGLATFNITFTSNGAQVTAQPPLEVVQEVQPARLEPTQAMIANVSVNADLAGLDLVVLDA